jgi:hypothetical protein
VSDSDLDTLSPTVVAALMDRRWHLGISLSRDQRSFRWVTGLRVIVGAHGLRSVYPW